jgi:hypothetical protein
MKTLLITTVALGLMYSPSFAAKRGPPCDQPSLQQVKADISSLSGKAKKKATRQLERAEQALKEGNGKKCSRILAKIESNLDGSAGPATQEGSVGPDQSDEGMPEEGDDSAQ